MHVNGCLSSNLSDVFPALPFQDPVTHTSLSGPLLNLNGINGNANMDVVSRIKLLGVNLPQSGNNPSSNSIFFNEDRSRTNLIINYLPQSYDQNDLQRLFERVGPIRQCKLIRDKNTGASLCYGFVDFVNPQHAALAIQTYHGYETEQKRLRVAYASSGGRRFTPARIAPFSNPSSFGGLTGEVTNENIIGWEVFVIGIPLEWPESDLLRLFNHFGNVVLIRLLPPQLSDSPPGQKPRLSPTLNGASSDMSSESIDNNKLTSSASVIFEEKASAELSVLRLNGYQAPEWPSPLRLRIIGSVTRETYNHFCLPSRQSPSLSLARIPNGHNVGDPLAESDLLSNLLNRRNLTTPTCGIVGKNSDQNCLSASADIANNMQVNSNPSFPLPPRAIIRNKAPESNISTLFDQNSFSHNNLDLMDLLEGQSTLSSITGNNMLTASDRFSNRDSNLMTTLNNRPTESDHSKLDQLRSLTNMQNNSPWSFTQNRSVLTTLPESGRTNDILNVNGIMTNHPKRLSIKSPLILSSALTNSVSQRGCQINVWLKLENIQPTGSFKIRGAENACRKWASSGAKHIVCSSGGNAGVAAAVAAHAYGLTCTLIVPENHDSTMGRRLMLEAPDAKVIVGGANWLEAHHRAEQIVADLQAAQNDNSVRLLHPFDQAELWDGYETIIDELSAEMSQPDAIVVAVGGGGLLAGVIQGLWNRGWSSTHVIAVEAEGADCLNRSIKAGQLTVIPKTSTIASSLSSPILSHRAWNLVQCYSIIPVTSSDADSLDSIKHFLDDHAMLVEPACGASLSTVYSGYLTRLQIEGRLPRPANVVVIVGGGRNVSLRQLVDWENQLNNFMPEQNNSNILPSSVANPFLSRTSPHTMCTDLISKAGTIGHHLSQIEPDESSKLVGVSTPSTPRAMCTILNRTAAITTDSHDTHSSQSIDRDVDANGDANGSLNPHDLVNFSKLLGSSEMDGEETILHD